MKMKDFSKLNKAFTINRVDIQNFGILTLFILIIIGMVIYYSDNISNPLLLGFTAIVGGYMALNIGANDVANNVGPAVGSKSLTMAGAITIAVICEISGALIAGGEVVNTIRTNIISLKSIEDTKTFITLMLAALISGALWLHFATTIGAPVSTTHSIVGGVLGAGIVAGGFSVVNWGELCRIILSWVVSSLAGGIIAAILLFFMKSTITYKQNKKIAAQKIVPYLIAFMVWAFSLYLINKGLKKVITLDSLTTLTISFSLAIITFFVVSPIIRNTLEKMENKKEEISKLFTIPLIFAAALLSFAHGANDVANAIGPLAAINDALRINLETQSSIKTPFWIMLLGGLGISIGLALFGPKLIKAVGNEITDLDQMRAFCIAMSAALTVLIASEVGMPVSSTHIAIGAIFGVGFLREYLKKRYKKMELKILASYKDKDIEKIKEFLEKFKQSSVKRKASILKNIDKKKAKQNTQLPEFKKKELKQLKKAYEEELVKRSAINKIVSAWLITVPVSAVIGGILYFLFDVLGF